MSKAQTPTISDSKNFATDVLARKSLKISIQLLTSIIILGQWIFLFYLIYAYGASAAKQGLSSWNALIPNGFTAGDHLGNTAVFLHITQAVIVMGLGSLQLLPYLRKNFPVFHRYAGRTYLVAALIASIVGVYMLLKRNTLDNFFADSGLLVDALLIMAFGILAFRCALRRNFQAHRRWALRLFLVVSAVWFFRIGVMFWIAIHQAPVGFDPETFKGPFLNVLSFAQYLLPLLVLELYFLADKTTNTLAKYLMTVLLFILSLALIFAIFVTFSGMWLPEINRVMSM